MILAIHLNTDPSVFSDHHLIAEPLERGLGGNPNQRLILHDQNTALSGNSIALRTNQLVGNILRKRQIKIYAGSFTDFAVDHNCPAMLLNRSINRREPEPAANPLRLGRKKRLKNPVLVF